MERIRKDISSFAFPGLHKRNGAEIRNLYRLAPYLSMNAFNSPIAGDVIADGRGKRL